MEFIDFRERLRDNAPAHVFDLWFDKEVYISKKYKLNGWQQEALMDVLHRVFLQDIGQMSIPNEIKKKLKIKDEIIVKSISLDIAIHICSLAKDYFINADNLIKSLGGEEAYWEKYSFDYWDQNVIAEPLITPGDIKNVYDIAKMDVLTAEIALKELEKSNAKDIIPDTYHSILSNFNKAKTKLESENYDLIRESKESVKEVIDDINKVKIKNPVITNQENNQRINKQKNKLESIRDKCLREKKLFEMYDYSLWLALILLIATFIFWNFDLYLSFAIITGLNFRHVASLDVKEKNLEGIITVIIGSVMAPYFFLMWSSMTESRRDWMNKNKQMYADEKKLLIDLSTKQIYLID